MAGVDPSLTQGPHDPPDPHAPEGPWSVSQGKVSLSGRPGAAIAGDGVEPLGYNNPFAQGVERAWYDGKIVFALDAGPVELSHAAGVKVAKEYQPVYAVELDGHGKLRRKDAVPGQLNIYDSVPGQAAYSPIWRFSYVEVPRDYQANALRSAEACEQSGYTIHESNVFEN